MTKKSAKKSAIEELTEKINQSSEYFVLAKESGHLVVGTVTPVKIRMEKSGNIFQPFGKNIDKDLPIYFPVIIDIKKAKSSEIVYRFNEFEISLLYLNKHQIKLEQHEIEYILYQYVEGNFKE